jgi:hypothetical protein
LILQAAMLTVSATTHICILTEDYMWPNHRNFLFS